MKRSSGLVFTLFFLMASKAFAAPVSNTVAYFGIAGQGDGMGSFGHAFLALSPGPEDFSRSNVYQYALEVPAALANTNVFEVLEKSPFVLTKEAARSFIQRYSNEGRVVALFKLRLSESDVVDLEQLLEEDLKRRQSISHYDYDIFTNNCLTQAVDRVNRVLPESLRISTNWTSHGFELNDGLTPESFLANVPFAFYKTLKNEPAIELDQGEPIYFRPKLHVSLRSGVLIARSLDKISSRCGWNQNKFQSLEKILLHPHLGKRDSFLSFLRSDTLRCGDSISQRSFDEIIEVFELAAETSEEKIRLRQYLFADPF